MQFDVPFVATYVPAEQFVHVPAAAALYVPTAQGVHSLAPAPEYVPAAQLAQVVALAAAACLPAAQYLHALADPLSLYCPAVHGVHACAPVGEKVPGSQGISALSHFARSSSASHALQNFPALQAPQLSQSPQMPVQHVSPREHCPAGHAETTAEADATRIHLKRLIIAPPLKVARGSSSTLERAANPRRGGLGPLVLRPALSLSEAPRGQATAGAKGLGGRQLAARAQSGTIGNNQVNIH
jgi:hypothetical protein